MLTLSVEAKVTFGVRAGISYTSLTQMIEEEVTYGGRAGFNVAGLLDIPLSKKFSLRPELSFVNQGGAYYLEYMESDLTFWDWEHHKCNYYSMQMPLNLTYKIPLNEWQFGVYGGPSISVSTQVKENDYVDERKFRSFDVGLGAGFYVEYRKFFFTICAHSGLLDRLTEKQPNESQIYQNNMTFSFGYWFR